MRALIATKTLNRAPATATVPTTAQRQPAADSAPQVSSLSPRHAAGIISRVGPRTSLIPVAASAQVQTQRDLTCWKPAFQNCVATTDGSQAGAKGCAGNYQKFMGAALTGITALKKSAFTDCVSANGVNGASVASCHENLLKTLASKQLPLDDFNIACWKPAYLDCVASVGGAASAVPGCYNNYLGCWTKRSTAESTCWSTFNTCLITTASVQFGVTSCHNSYLGCVAK